MHQLINQSYVIYQHARNELSDAIANGEQKLPDNTVAAISKEYRSVLTACLTDLNNAPAGDAMSDDVQGSPEYNYFADASTLWHLAELFLLSRNSANRTSGLIVGGLVEWIRDQHGEVTVHVETIIRGTQDNAPFDEMLFYKTLTYLIVLKELDQAASLLTYHPECSPGGDDGFAVIKHLLDTLPEMEGSTSQYYRTWTVWRTECRNYISSPHLERFPKLQQICKLLSGYEDDIAAVGVENDMKWWDILVAKLQFTKPLAKLFDLEEDIDWAIRATHQDPHRLPPFEKMIVATMSQLPTDLIRDSCNYFGDQDGWWFASHLTDLFSAAGIWKNDTLKETFTLEFASALFSHPSLWSVGAMYLRSCGARGANYLPALLEKVPLESDRKALKVIRVCRNNNLKGLAGDICRVMGRRAKQQDRIGSALAWFLRAEDGASVTQVADELLRRFKTSDGDRTFEHMDVIEKFGSAMYTHSPRLTFLVLYKEFHERVARREFKTAAEIMIKVFNSPGMAPQWFRIDLLLDAQCLLAHEETVFDVAQTQQLMQHLTDLSLSHHKESYLSGVSAKELQTLRFLLTRNLSRAILVAHN